MNAIRSILRHDLVRRSAYFSVAVVASTLVGVASIPLLTSVLGADTWGQLFLLQVVGQFAAMLVAFGWGATGPSTVSALPLERRKQFFVDSVWARGALFLAVAPLAWIICVWVGGDAWAAALAVITYGIPGIGAAWFFVGVNRPGSLIMFDSLPSIVGQVGGLICVIFIPTITAYLAATAAATSIGIILGICRVLFSSIGTATRPSVRGLLSTMRRQVPGLVTVLSTGLSSTIPALIVNGFAHATVPVFGMVDRLYKYGIIVLTPILQAVQGWVPESGAHGTAARAKSSLWVGGAVGLVGGLGLGLLASPVASLLTVGQVSIPPLVSALAGVGFAAECVSQVTGLAGLVALRKERELARSAVWAAGVGLAVMIPAVMMMGLVGAVGVIALTAIAVAAYRVVVLLSAAKSSRTPTDIPASNG